MKILGNLLLLANVYSVIFGHLQDGYSKLIYGYRLDRKMINSFTEFSILDCIEECLRTMKCKSVSYFKGANYCEISYDNKGTAPERFIEDKRWIYSEREDLNPTMTGACMNATCLANQKCNTSPLGNYECLLSDCSIPHVEGADMNNTDRWDGIGILRRIHIKCYQEFYLTGSRFLTCQSTGRWMSPSCEWRMYEDHIYLLQASNLTWQEAKEKCEGFQAYLTEIESENENIWITNMLMNPFFGKTTIENIWTKLLWIGASDMEVEGRFIWSHSNKLLQNAAYQNWNSGEPNNAFNDEHCVVMSHLFKGKWNDFACTELRPFVCEKEVEP